jgi:hypothetical protein
LIATALAGIVLSRTGDLLVQAFHGASWIGASLALTAGVTAFLSLSSLGYRRSEE